MIHIATGPVALAMRDDWLPVLQKAIDDADGRWSAEQLLADVETGKVIVWIVSSNVPHGTIRGVFTTRAIESRVRWILVEDCAGDALHEWIYEALHALEAWARELGATQIVFEGRRGWERVLRGYGYETTRIQGVKRLENLN